MSRCDLSWDAVTCSRTLDVKGRFEMERKLLGMVGSRAGFFNMGVMVASLSEGGTEPVIKEELMMVVMSGESEGRQSLTREEGIGSRAQVVGFMPETREKRSDSVMGVKDERGWSGGGGSVGWNPGGEEGAEAVSSVWMWSILDWKNDRKELQVLVVKELLMVSMGLSSLFMVEKSVRGLLEPVWMMEE